MKLTTKGRFAVAAMVDLALQHEVIPGCLVTLSGISQRQHISLSYLEQLFGMLRRARLVESMRGPGGGYSLARPSAQIVVGQIVRAVDESVDSTQCGGRSNCKGENRACVAHRVWEGLNETVSNYLNSITLQMIVDWQPSDQKGVRLRPLPSIKDAFLPLSNTSLSPQLTSNSIFSWGQVLSQSEGADDQEKELVEVSVEDDSSSEEQLEMPVLSTASRPWGKTAKRRA